jgi:hypothetical protein
MRRATNPTRKISITLPGSIFNELERFLSYDQSRSAFIASAVAMKMQKDNSIYFDEIPTSDLLSALEYRFPKDSPEDVLIQSLLQIFTK